MRMIAPVLAASQVKVMLSYALAAIAAKILVAETVGKEGSGTIHVARIAI